MNFLTLQAADGASATICDQGAHVCSWIPAGGREQLFLSRTSAMADGVAIRGGVPVIFPQFAALGRLPRHGFARTSAWRLLRSGRRADGTAQAVYQLKENRASLVVWPQAFCAELSVTLHGQRLEIALEVENSGDARFSFTCALHSYLAVADIAAASLHGLQGLRYRDSVSGNSDVLETADALRIDGETDRIYSGVPAVLELRQPQQSTRIASSGFADAVVWNPGLDGAVKLADLEAGGERRMLCVEAAAIVQPVRLAAGERWRGSQTLDIVLTDN
ncbi:MAG: D-hexose-6-phosphate mutarotase [Burkholderiales bacterium]|nr:D-hexose-6-phosphate mutarotase [Burkholderiales bacterium]